MKPHLHIYTGAETTNEEIEIIQQSFSEHFDVTIDKSIIRLSEDNLPFLLNFSLNVLASSIGSLAIICIHKLLNRLQSDKHRNPIVKIDVQQGHTNKQVNISQSHVNIINFNTKPNPTEEIYDTIEQAFEHLEDTLEKGT